MSQPLFPQPNLNHKNNRHTLLNCTSNVATNERTHTTHTRGEMRILLTGGAGFIGSHMCDHLVQQGHQVYCIDNCMSGSLENLKHLNGNPNFFFKQFDITELGPHTETFSTAFFDKNSEAQKFDQVYHMACPASPVTYQKDPVKTLMTNVLGAYNLLEIARTNKARFLTTSTSEVYGDPLEHPQKETYWGNVNCTGIRSCYDEGKRAAESLTFDFNRTRGVDVRVARIFNTYGPRMMIDDGRIISNFVAQALTGKPLTIYGTGQQTRSFCYIADMINGLDKLMNQDTTIGPVNLGNPGEFTVSEAATIVKELVGASVQIEYHPLPLDDPKQRKPDISKAKKDLGWEPTVPFREGLKLTIEDFAARLKK